MTPKTILKQIVERREPLSRSSSDIYINSHELQELWDLEETIKRGLEAQRRAAAYLEWRKTNSFDRRAFADYYDSLTERSETN